ncbi:MAG: MFS transporter [Chloroflexota bacterium]
MRRVTARVRSLSYGWWVAVAGGLAMAVTVGPIELGASALFAAIEADSGWSRTVVSGAASVGQFGRAVLSPIQGALVDRVGPRWMVFAGLSLSGTAAILLSLVHDPFWYYACFLAMSSGIGLGAFVPSMSAVNRWLPHRRASGMALVVGGGSFGTALVPLVALGIGAYGWRPTVIALGVLLIALAPVLAWVIGRPPPAEGQSAEPGSPAQSERRNRLEEASEFTVGEALRTRTFWAMTVAHTFANLSVAALAAHVILHLTDIGISFAAASVIVPVMGATAFVGQIVGGFVGDRLNKRLAASALLALQGVSILVLTFAVAYPLVILFAVMWGVGFGARTPILHAMRGDYFGRRSFATILGMSSLMLSLGMMASPVIVGWMFDQQGTYHWAFIGLAAGAFLASGIMMTATRPTKGA